MTTKRFIASVKVSFSAGGVVSVALICFLMSTTNVLAKTPLSSDPTALMSNGSDAGKSAVPYPVSSVLARTRIEQEELAKQYAEKGDFAKALPLYQAILDDYETRSVDPSAESQLQLALHITDVATALERMGQFAKAEPLYLRALAIAEKADGPESPVTGKSLRNLSELYQSDGKYAKAMPLLVRSLAIAEKALGPEHPDTGRSLNSLAHLYADMGQNAKALPISVRAVSIAEQALGLDHPDTAKSLFTLGAIYTYMGNYTKGVQLHARALAIRERVFGPEHPETGDGVAAMATAYLIIGDLASAEPLYIRALAISEKTLGPEHLYTGNTLKWLGALYVAMGRYAKAEPLLVRALAIIEKAAGPAHTLTGTTLANLANLYMTLGQYAKAEHLLVRGLAVEENALGPEHRRTGLSLNSLAQVYRDMGQYAKAELLFVRALVITEKSDGPVHRLTGDSLHSLALLYLSMGQYAKAEPLFVRALAIAEKPLGPEHIHTSARLRSLARLYTEMGQQGKAEPLYLRSLSIAMRHTEAPIQRFATQKSYAQFLRKQGRNEPAIFFGKLAVNTFQSVREAAKGLDSESQKSLFETNQQIYQDLSDWLIEAGRLAEAEQVLSMLKQQELQELTRRSGPVAQQVTMTGAELAPAQRFQALSSDGVKSAAALESLNTREKQGGVLSAAELTERERLRSVLATQRESMQVFLSSLQASLSKDVASAEEGRDGLERGTRQMQTLLRKAGPGHVGLHYVVTDERLSIIVTLAESSFARQIPMARATLNRQIAALRQVLKRPSIDPQPAAQALYASLIAPVQEELKAAGAHTLVLSLTDLLRYVPFAALNDGQQYLVERYALTLYTPAGGQGISATNTRQWQIAGLGVTQAVTMKDDSDRAFSALPSVRAELDGIVRSAASPAGLVPGSIALDPQFTRLRFEQSLPRFPVLHVASHFQFTPGSEYLSYLVLGDGSRLSLADLKEMDFNGVQLLTLSACDTASGGGRNERGSEVEGLGAAVQLAGAKAVLASLWQVSDASTAQLMRRFYELRTRDNTLTTAQALRQAQLDMLRGEGTARAQTDAKTMTASTQRTAVASGGAGTGAASNVFSTPFTADPKQPFAHPYFWAPFILMGNWL